jgi:hypothetical protein
MARQIEEIYDGIIESKENRTELEGLLPDNETSTQLLEDLNSDSKVAIWRLWAWITASVMHIHETLWDLFKTEVEAIVASAPAGTPAWYHKKVFEYQHEDELIYEGTTYKYATIDPDKMIVKACAIDERRDGVVVVKVAKRVSGSLVPLSNDEKNGLVSYVNKIKFAGTRTSVFTSNADELNIVYDIYYDPIVPLSSLKIAVQKAVDEHLGNLPFNGNLSITKFTDALQSVRGVLDPVFLSAESTAIVSGDTTEFTIEHRAASGYFVLADSVDNLFIFKQKL